MRIRLGLLTVLLTTAFVSSSVALPPLDALIPFHRTEADPNKSYPLLDEHGPWLVLAASFVGETAEQDAHDLVIEIRKEYHLEAFTYRRHFDFTEPVQARGINSHGDPLTARHALDVAFEEIAVVVGHFATVDDPDMANALEDIKYAQPECLVTTPESTTSQRFAGLRAWYQQFTNNEERRQRGPMGNAFVTRNPLLPPPSAAQGVVEPFVAELNEDVRYSLLDCPGQYTVRVASFRGHSVIDQREIAEIQNGGEFESGLARAAEQAHAMTLALRDIGEEAYEFHDRNESVVCVGSFDTLGTPRQDGQIEINPAVNRVINSYRAVQRDISGNLVDRDGNVRHDLPDAGRGVLQSRAINNIPFDAQPTPVVVPRAASTSRGGFRFPGT